jgi:hypothetical protein
MRGSMGRMQSAGDIDMAARNRAGGAVPGLPGLKFAGSIEEGARKGAASHALFHSPDRMSHPAIGWSKSMAGIDGLAGSEIDRITGETHGRLAQSGIFRDETGTWRMSGTPGMKETGPASGISTQAAKSPLTKTPPIGATRPAPGTPLATSSAKPGSVTLGDIGPNTTTKIDVSGGTQTVTDTDMAAIADYLKNGGTPPESYTRGQPTPPGGTTPSAQGYMSPERAAQIKAEQAAEVAASKHPSTASVPPLPSQAPIRPLTQAEVAAKTPASLPKTHPANGLPIIEGGEPLTPEAKAAAARNQAQPIPSGTGQQVGRTSVTPTMPVRPPNFGQGPPTQIPSNQATMPGNGSFQRGMENMRNAFAQAFGQKPAPTGTVPGGGLRDTIMSGIFGAQQASQASQAAPAQAAPATQGGYQNPAMNVAAPAGPMAPSPGGGISLIADQIIRQETGGQDLTGQTNCTIRPEAGCLALNSGIFEVTAAEYGMDFNRIVNDPAYAKQAVEQLMNGYAQDDASKWGGPSGITVWEWGNQNLPGGGAEAVARVYFGGDVTGQFVDEQGRSGATYGQQFMDKLYAEGYNPQQASAPTATEMGATGQGVMGTAPVSPAPQAPAEQLPIIEGGEPLTPEAKAAAAAQQPTSSGYVQPPADTPFAPARLGETSGGTTGGYMHPESQLGQMAQGLQQSGAMNVAAPAIGAPQGAIRTDVIGFGTGGNWEDYNTYDPLFTKYGQQFGVDPALLKGQAIVEGGGAAGTPDNGWGNGMMQIQPNWQAEADRLGLPPINTDEGQIAMAAAILGGHTTGGVKGDWKTNFNNLYFPGAVETRTGSGITGGQYIQAVETLANDIHAAGGVAAPPMASGTAGTPGVGDVGNLGVRTIQGPTPGGTGNNTGVSPNPLPTIQGPTPGGSGNLGGVDPVTGQVVNPPMKVGADAVSAQPQPELLPGSDKPMAVTDQIFGAGANRKIGTETIPIEQLPTDPSTGAKIDPATGTAVTPAGGNAPVDGAVRPPKTTGVISAVQTPMPDEMTGISQGQPTMQGDGLGIYAGPEADESWVQTLSPNGGINGDYKEHVCTERYGEYGCCQGGSCSYASSELYLDGAAQTVHPGYDIALENGTPFYAPVGGVVLGTSSQPGGPGCQSPGGTSECSWAYDNGMVIGGITDAEGGEIYINFDHTAPDESLVGQTVEPGQMLGVGLDKSHVHVEAHGYCSDTGKMVVLDPSLVMGGFYNTHSACEGVSRPVAPEPAASSPAGKSSYMAPGTAQQLAAAETGYTPPPAGQATGQTDASTSGGNYSAAPAPAAAPAPTQSYQAPQHVAPTTTGQTGQVVTDEAGKQYEVMADGSLRLIYDPAW